MLELKRPLIIFDLETTGVVTERDRIIDLAAIKVYPDGLESEFTRRYNPGISIPKEATAVHGITDDDVKDCFQFGTFEAEEVYQFFKDCDIAGYNVKFDMDFLKATLLRVGLGIFVAEWQPVVIDAFKIFTMFEPRTLTAAVRFYCGDELVGAHNALVDVLATRNVLKAQLKRYPSLPTNLEGLGELLNRPAPGFLDSEKKFRWINGEACIAFGKHNGRPLRELDANYLTWITKGEFSPEVKLLATNALKKVFPREPNT